MSGKQILVLLGGTDHDFEGFSIAIRPFLEAGEHRVETSYDLGALTHLGPARPDLVLLYNCLGTSDADDGAAEIYTDTQVDALARWVRRGGGLLAVHSATVAARHNLALRALLGGVFLEHPPRFAFTVYPLNRRHPITAGIPAFTVHDEFYVQLYEPDVSIHMVALDRGVAHPMVWSRIEGQGRVAHVAPGHDGAVWKLKPYQQLMRQAADWLTA